MARNPLSVLFQVCAEKVRQRENRASELRTKEEEVQETETRIADRMQSAQPLVEAALDGIRGMGEGKVTESATHSTPFRGW